MVLIINGTFPVIFNCNLNENDAPMGSVSEMSNKVNDSPGCDEKTPFKEPFQSFLIHTVW